MEFPISFPYLGQVMRFFYQGDFCCLLIIPRLSAYTTVVYALQGSPGRDGEDGGPGSDGPRVRYIKCLLLIIIGVVIYNSYGPYLPAQLLKVAMRSPNSVSFVALRSSS